MMTLEMYIFHAGCLLANIGVSAMLEPRQDFTVIDNRALGIGGGRH